MARMPTSTIAAPVIGPPRLSLLGTVGFTDVPDPTPAPDSERVGFKFVSEVCGTSSTYPSDVCFDDDAPDKNIEGDSPTIEQDSIVIWVGKKCSTFGSAGRDWSAQVRRKLEARQSFRVARELWTGDEADDQGSVDNRRLASADAVEVTDAAVSPTLAIAALEYASGECGEGQRAVIHVTRHLAVVLEAEAVLHRVGAGLYTVNDSLVIVDAGYDGSSPTGVPMGADSQWAYATGEPIIRMGGVKVVPSSLDEATNRRSNTIEYRAEREVAAGWDGCCHFAAHVNVGAAPAGS